MNDPAWGSSTWGFTEFRSEPTSIAEHTTRDAGRPGVRLQMYTDLRQALEDDTPPEPTLAAE
ncbi:DUF6207 family protein [Streptomyces sp. CG1]|uniref:DUF6207 family protein n=1 Tax=Streptomyces sp. CG1 TaxID=1287523 RepID=UPI0034E1CFFB